MPPYWKRIGVGLLAVVVVVAIILSWARFTQDFWPLDRSFVGPNLLASAVQWVLVVIVGVLIWPPTRRRIHAFIDGKLDGVKDHVSAEHVRLHARLDQLEAHHHHLGAKTDAILRHLEHPDEEEEA